MSNTGRFNIYVSPEEKEIWNELHSYEKRYGKRSIGFRQIVKDKLSLQEENKELRKENEKLKAFTLYLNDVKNPLHVEFVHCNFQYLLEGNMSQRECSLNNRDRGFNLPKVHGKFIVDDPQKCANCKVGLYKKFIKHRVSRKTRQSKSSPEPITHRKCPMFDGDYVDLAVCGNCQERTPREYDDCQRYDAVVLRMPP